jgi:acetoin utilization deacetylase AcuC-like enzyme
VLTLYDPVQRRHRPAYTLHRGRRSAALDTPARTESILAALDREGIGPVEPPDDPGLDPILAVHDAGMVAFLQAAHQRHQAGAVPEDPDPVFPTFFPPPGQRRRPASFEGQRGYYAADTEVPIDAATWPAARAAAHCAWTGARRLLDGARHVYALCRPPGHHAGPDVMGGYCYLNNVAVAAQWLGQAGRVAIVDIDYHHGNGTQAIFYANPGVWYGSLHVDPNEAYPYFAGYAAETGAGAGAGTNRNVPLPPGTGEAPYLAALAGLLDAAAAFDPRWIVVSAGFDTYERDPTGTFTLTRTSFAEIGRRLAAMGRPTLIVQEGGYCPPGIPVTDPARSLGANVAALLQGMASA